MAATIGKTNTFCIDSTPERLWGFVERSFKTQGIPVGRKLELDKKQIEKIIKCFAELAGSDQLSPEEVITSSQSEELESLGAA